MTRELAWKPRCVMTMLLNSSATSTLDISSVPGLIVPRPPTPVVPTCGSPELVERANSRVLTIRTKKLVLGLIERAKQAGVPVQVHQAGSMLCVFFSAQEVEDWEGAAACDQEAFKVWFRAMLEQGIYLAPSQFETIFVSGAHTDEDIERTLLAAEKAFAAVADTMRK